MGHVRTIRAMYPQMFSPGTTGGRQQKKNCLNKAYLEHVVLANQGLPELQPLKWRKVGSE